MQDHMHEMQKMLAIYQTEMLESMRSLKLNFQELSSDFKALSSEVQELSSDFKALSSEVQELSSDFREFKQQTSNSLVKLSSDFKALSSEVQELSSDFREFKQQTNISLDNLKEITGRGEFRVVLLAVRHLSGSNVGVRSSVDMHEKFAVQVRNEPDEKTWSSGFLLSGDGILFGVFAAHFLPAQAKSVHITVGDKTFECPPIYVNTLEDVAICKIPDSHGLEGATLSQLEPYGLTVSGSASVPVRALLIVASLKHPVVVGSLGPSAGQHL